MEQLLLKLRNAGAVICACVVFIIFVVNVYLFGSDVFARVSQSVLFETAQTIWWLTLVAAVVAGLGNFLYMTEDERKADVLVFCGISVIISFLFAGMFYVCVGFHAGEIWKSILMMFVTAYACLIVFFCTSYFTRVLRNIMPHRDEDDEWIAIG